MSKQQQEQFLQEVLDPEKVSLYCGEHMYFGPGKARNFRPKDGCSRCWLVYFIQDIATTPPHERQKRVDELEQVIHHMVEALEHGNWDFKPWVRPEITIRKDTDDPGIVLTDIGDIEEC